MHTGGLVRHTIHRDRFFGVRYEWHCARCRIGGRYMNFAQYCTSAPIQDLYRREPAGWGVYLVLGIALVNLVVGGA